MCHIHVMSLMLNDTFRCHTQMRAFQLAFIPLQAPDSNTQFRALAVVRERSFGEHRWSSCRLHSATKLLAPSSSIKSAVFILLHGCTQSVGGQELPTILLDASNSLRTPYFDRFKHNQVSTISRLSSLTELPSSSLRRVVYKREGGTRATNIPPV